MTAAAPRKPRWRAAFILLAALALALAAGLFAAGPSGVREALAALQAFRDGAAEAVGRAVPWPALARPLAVWTRGVLLAPHLFLPLAFILLAEWVVPAMTSQKVLSPALANDFLWYLAEIGVFLAANAWVAETLSGFYGRYVGPPGAGVAASLPDWLAFGFAVLASDLLDWFHHFVRHKVRVFWWFHAVHHAQRDMNAWTNERVHVVEYIVATVIRFVPATVLGVSTAGIMGYALLAAWYTRLCHANIRTNLGPLRYVLVTPQSHRVHHSIRPEHFDKNFGVIFSVWDRVFGTQCPDDDVYPETGIRDATFPQERRWGETLSLRPFLAQQIYPLRLLARRFRPLYRAARRTRREPPAPDVPKIGI